MRLDLRDIIHVPDGKKTFQFQLDLSGQNFYGSKPIVHPVQAEGSVTNHAGALVLEGTARSVLELACDRRVLNGLDAGRRREYAKTLVELASGRQLWEAPLAFGECGAQVRVKAAAEWKPDKLGRFLAGWAVFLALALFALGGPLDRGLPQDILLALERQDSTVEDLTQWAQSSIRNHSGVAQVQVEELWLDNVESRSADLYVRTPDGWWSGCLHCQRRGALLFGWSALDSPPLTRDMYRVR